jgi:hypothetical protein
VAGNGVSPSAQASLQHSHTPIVLPRPSKPSRSQDRLPVGSATYLQSLRKRRQELGIGRSTGRSALGRITSPLCESPVENQSQETTKQAPAEGSVSTSTEGTLATTDIKSGESMTQDREKGSKESTKGTSTVECCCCTSDVGRPDAFSAPCGIHHYCDACAQRLFRDCLGGQTRYPAKYCDQPLDYEQMWEFLGHELCKQLQSKQEELEDDQRVYCHVQSCGSYINKNYRKDTAATCGLCLAETCTLCSQAAHVGECPTDPEVQQTLIWGEQAGAKRCKKCGYLVLLYHGCNHMT